MNKVQYEGRAILSDLIGKSITYGALLVGLSEATKHPVDYESLVLLGLLAATGKTISTAMYYRNRALYRKNGNHSKLEELAEGRLE